MTAIESLYLTDFEVSKAFDEHQILQTSTLAGTTNYIAPEVAKAKKGSQYEPLLADGKCFVLHHL